MSNQFARFSFLTGAIIGLIVFSGCGGEPKATVSGTVTLDGVPIENGTISFYPTGKAGQTAGAGIEKGMYTVEASVGEMTVQISASKVVGKHKAYDTPDSPMIEEVEELIAAEYNSASTLKVTLKPGINENVNFEVKSKKKHK